MPVHSLVKRLSRMEHVLLEGYFGLNLLAVLVGVAGGFVAIGFRGLISGFHFAFFTQGATALGFMGGYYVILLPAIGGLMVGLLVHFLAREAKGHGVPEVMEAVAHHGGRIRPRVVLVKAFASSITLGSGGSAGREGPIVHIGSAFGSSVGQFFKVSGEHLRILVGCGAAAGIAATFNGRGTTESSFL